ncbi:MAG: alpha/beta fold hydrolase [Dehalococcoidia bacterium]
MNPRIEYATTRDGFAIAMATVGSGPVLVSIPSPPDNHVGLEWADERRRPALAAIASHRTLVRFDGRGTGLSDREIDSYSIEDRLLDLDAVVTRTGAPSVSMVTGGFGAQLAIAYAARNPERVNALVAVNPFLAGREFMPPDQLPMWRGMLTSNFRFFSDAVGAETFGWGHERAREYGDFLRQAVGHRNALLIYDAMVATDVTDDAAQVRCQVLLLQVKDTAIGSAESARRAARRIAGARIGFLGGRPVEGLSGEMVQAIGDFFGEAWDAPDDRQDVPASAVSEPSLKTILFTDLEGHTAVMQRLGDREGRRLLRSHEQLTREALAAHGGNEVKSLGDGFLASFGSAQRALECALTIQQRTAAAESGLAAAGLRVRIGINAGEPIAEDGDLFGASVITAARIAAKARGGEVLVANVVRELVAGKGFLFHDTGAHALKGIEDPVRIWELRVPD